MIDTLCSLRPTLVLLPNLRALDWPVMDMRGTQLPSTLSLLGDAITTLHIRDWDLRTASEQHLRASIAIVTSRFRSLTRLDISILDIGDLRSTITSETCAAMSALVSGSYSLVKMNCHGIPLSRSSIIHLARLSTLKDVGFQLPESTLWPPAEPGFQAFASLTSISLTTTLSAYIPFSRALPLPHIHELNLYVTGEPLAQLIPDFFSAIRHQLSPASLRKLAIDTSRIPSASTAHLRSAVIRPSDLQPLLDFSRMEHFDLGMECRYAFNDAFIFDAVNAWPCLTSFFLASDNCCFHDTLPTLTSLVHLAMYAPDLSEVGLQFDAAGWIHGPVNDSGGLPEQSYGDLQGRASTSSVFSLHVGISPIAGPASVTLFLARIFPALGTLTAGRCDDVGQAERWREVERYLPLFAQIRRDERRRMRQEGVDGEDESEDNDEGSADYASETSLSSL